MLKCLPNQCSTPSVPEIQISVLLAQSPIGPFLVVHLIYDVRDAMGANALNTAAERLAPRIEALTGGRVQVIDEAGQRERCPAQQQQVRVHRRQHELLRLISASDLCHQ